MSRCTWCGGEDTSKEMQAHLHEGELIVREMIKEIEELKDRNAILQQRLEEKTPKKMSRAGDEGDTKAWREACDEADGMRQCLLIQPDIMRYVCDHIDMLKEQIRVADVAYNYLHKEHQALLEEKERIAATVQRNHEERMKSFGIDL